MKVGWEDQIIVLDAEAENEASRGTWEDHIIVVEIKAGTDTKGSSILRS